MPKFVVSEGDDFLVELAQRGGGGIRKEAFKVDGIGGNVLVNGVPIGPAEAKGLRDVIRVDVYDTATNSTPSGVGQVIDDVTIVENMTVYKRGGAGAAGAARNGVWITKSGSWERHPDYPQGFAVAKGTVISVVSGTNYHSSLLVVDTNLVIGVSNNNTIFSGFIRPEYADVVSRFEDIEARVNSVFAGRIAGPYGPITVTDVETTLFEVVIDPPLLVGSDYLFYNLTAGLLYSGGTALQMMRLKIYRNDVQVGTGDVELGAGTQEGSAGFDDRRETAEGNAVFKITAQALNAGDNVSVKSMYIILFKALI